MQPCSNSTMLQLILNNTINMNMNNLTDDLVSSVRQPMHLRWGMLSLVLVIICAASGNLLVCMAVCWERRLQNMTNYFLMSLAIADFLVSIVVMPLGMVVEIFGFFPMSAHMCIFWVTTDVLMCTASIWHMSTMSMDRFFTLKYPMRYGRNKTKRMVCVKILFVWLVSIAVSCPVSIAGLLDTRTVFNDGQCVPTIPTFLISGSVFAFYIPLLIMIVTYALTIQILWENQNLMTRIEKSDNRASEKAIPEKKEYSITSRSQPDTTPDTRNRNAMSETDGPDTNVVGISEIGQVEIPQALIRHHEMRAARAHWTQCDSVRNSFDSAQTTITTCTLGSEQGTSIAPSRTGSESFPPLIDPHKMRRKSLQLPLQRRRCSKVHFERVPSADTVKEPTPVPLYPSKSYSHLMEINQWNVSSLVKGSHYHSYHGLNNNLGLDPKRSYDHLPDDVFPCLIGLVDEDEDENDDVFEAGDEAAHCRSIQNPVIPLRVSVSSIDENVSEKDEEVDSQVKVETKTDANPTKPPPPTTTTTTKSTPEKNLGQQPVAYNGNIPNGNISNGNIPNGTKETLLKKNYHNKVTRTFRNFLKAHLRRANEKPKIKKAFRHLLSNKTASNEKKALKVLGIIFAVFVILWTPFFIVNIITATCTDCMKNVTPEMMSIFLWMGYVASLANPLIYTMFNTSFRRAFVKILTCKYQTPRVYNESSCLSFAASWHFDRRNTIMMYLKEEMANN